VYLLAQCGEGLGLIARSEYPLAGTRVQTVAYRLCVISPKGIRRNPDAAGADLLDGTSKQQVPRFMQRATQMQWLGGVSIILLFQVP
jgi:hypothetical protein